MKNVRVSHRTLGWDNNGENSKVISGIFWTWRSLRESNPCFSLERAAS